jgi:predicted XRE-type DNA-binding protein
MKKGKLEARIIRNAAELADALNLSEVDAALMIYKAEMSQIAVQAIQNSGMSVNEVVEKSGVARSKVSAVKNGATVSVSIDLLVKIIAATGTKLKVRAA